MSSVLQSYPPVNAPMIDKNGMVTAVWAKWFNQNYIQTGSSGSTTLTSLITTVETLDTEVSANTTNITAIQEQVNGLGVGRQL